MTSKLLRYLSIALFVLLLLAIATFKWIMPPIAQTRLEIFVNKDCESCHLQIDTLKISLLHPGRISLKGVHFASGLKGAEQVEARVVRVAAQFNLWALLHKELQVDQLNFEQPDVTFIDGDKTSQRQTFGDIRQFRILRSEALNGRFTYVRDHLHTHAVLHIQNIHASLGPFGNSAELKNEPLHATSTLQIEDSGEVTLKVITPIFEKPLNVEVEIRVANQNLAALNPFFKTNVGVNLTGLMVKGIGHVRVNNHHLQASVKAEYRDFSVHLDPTEERSELAAFFTNLGSAIALRQRNLGHAPVDQTRSVEADRLPHESIVSFILQGLKKAALKVAEN